MTWSINIPTILMMVFKTVKSSLLEQVEPLLVAFKLQTISIQTAQNVRIHANVSKVLVLFKPKLLFTSLLPIILCLLLHWEWEKMNIANKISSHNVSIRITSSFQLFIKPPSLARVSFYCHQPHIFITLIFSFSFLSVHIIVAIFCKLGSFRIPSSA